MATKRKPYNLLSRRAQNKLIKNDLTMLCMEKVLQMLNQQGLAVVPLSWYSDGECRWPDHKEREYIKSLVDNKVKPKESWLTYKARTVGNTFYGNLLQARKICALAESTSDLNSEPEQEKGKRKIYHVQYSSESEEEDSSSGNLSQGFPMPPTLGKIIDARASPIAVGNSCSSSADALLREDGKKSPKFFNFEEEVLGTLMFLKHSMVDMSKRLSALETPVCALSSDATAKVASSLLGSYPIVTQRQLEEKEKKLQDGSYRKQLIQLGNPSGAAQLRKR